MEQINIEDWTDRCSKCGYHKMISKNLHRDSTCTREPEALDVLSKHWDEYTKRIKPILRILKENYRKDVQEGILLKGLRDLIESNTKNMDSNMTKLMNNLRKETVPHDGTETKTEAGVARVAKITKPAKVPTWTKRCL